MATKPSNTQDTEVVLNKINLALARSQRLLSTWLPPRPDSAGRSNGDAHHDGKAEEEDEDEDLFKAESEL